MPNRVRNETIKIRNQTLTDLKRIYAAEWDKIGEDVIALVNEMYLDPEQSTQAERIKYAKHKRDKLVDLIVAAAVLANTKAIRRINSNMDIIYTLNADDLVSYVLERTGVNIASKDVDIKSLLGKHTKRRYDNATDSKYVSRQVMKEINNMLKAGEGQKAISRRLQKVFDKNKVSANRITITETTRTENRAKLDMMLEAEKNGMKFKKIWRHSGRAAEPRDWHLAMDGEARNLDEPFSNGLMRPGEDGAPAEEVINCSCFMDRELVEW